LLNFYTKTKETGYITTIKKKKVKKMSLITLESKKISIGKQRGWLLTIAKDNDPVCHFKLTCPSFPNSDRYFSVHISKNLRDFDDMSFQHSLKTTNIEALLAFFETKLSETLRSLNVDTETFVWDLDIQDIRKALKDAITGKTISESTICTFMTGEEISLPLPSIHTG